MSIETDTKVKKLEEQMQQVQYQMAQIMAAIDAMVEISDNAVVEGDDLTPKVRNGKLRKADK